MLLLRSMSLICCLLLLFPAEAQSDEKVKAFAMKYANRYCSNAAEILDAEDAKSIAFYMQGEAKDLDIGDFGTAVHEALHNYDWELADAEEEATPEWGDRYKSYFINTGIVLSTEEQSVFKTATLHDQYFPEAVKQMSRYGTYIRQSGNFASDENSKLSQEELAAYGIKELKPGESLTTSNVKGIYGLMEEFNAYHHGIKAEYEVITGMDDSQLRGSTNSVAAYFEFNVFMAYYIKYAQTKERGVYQLMMNDRNLRIAYTLIELSWRELITQVYANDLTTNYFMYWRGEPDLYTDELQKVMRAFMIPTSQLGEYAEYARSKQYDPDVIALVKRKIAEDGNRSSSFSSDTDFDWGDWDSDDENVTTHEASFEIEPFTSGRHYVVVDVESDPFSLIKKINDYKKDQVSIGMDIDDPNTYYFFIASFGTLGDAQNHVKKYRSKYPNIKVLSR